MEEGRKGDETEETEEVGVGWRVVVKNVSVKTNVKKVMKKRR